MLAYNTLSPVTRSVGLIADFIDMIMAQIGSCRAVYRVTDHI